MTRLFSLAFGLLTCLSLSACFPPTQRTFEIGPFVRAKGALDEAAHRRLLREAAEAGDTHAMVNRAVALANGPFRSRKDEVAQLHEVMRLFRTAAERGDAMAQVDLGAYCLQVAPPVAAEVGACQDRSEAAQWFARAMAQGSGIGTEYYAYMVEHGLGGLRQDPAEAARLRSLARARDDPGWRQEPVFLVRTR